MSDLFTACEGEPTRVAAGDLWTWRRDHLASLYPTTTYALDYTLTPTAGGTPVAFSAVADAAGWLIEVPAATTSGVSVGVHVLVCRLRRLSDGALRVSGESRVTVDPDPATSTADTRSRNRRILEAIEARIEGRISKDAEAYTIEGRSISRTPLEVLHKMVGHYRRAVATEEGRPSHTVRKVKFT